MADRTSIYRRNLPHIHPQGFPIFITFNLIDSVPAEIIQKLKAKREQELKAARDHTERQDIERKYFSQFDEWLDRCEQGPHWLEGEAIAGIVAEEIQRLDRERYLLMAYCIMPNHVHMLIKSLSMEGLEHHGKTASYPVADSLRLVKGRSARFCNQELHREGSFWHHESYDHYARNEEEATRIIQYIINNPVKAGLANNWKDWNFTYLSPELGKW